VRWRGCLHAGLEHFGGTIDYEAHQGGEYHCNLVNKHDKSNIHTKENLPPRWPSHSIHYFAMNDKHLTTIRIVILAQYKQLYEIHHIM
jgi:hypothetical protein